MTSNAAIYPGLKGRTAVVTGGASGIGAEIVRALAEQGVKTAFLDLAVAEGMALSRETGALFLKTDLLETAGLATALAECAARLGPIAILINNAANDDRRAPEAITPDYWDWSQNVNLRHYFFAAQAVRQGMVALGGGAIVNISSIAWRLGVPGLAAYSTAKAGIVGLTIALASEFGADRIRVNAIEPGAVMTEKQRRLWYPTEASVAAMVERQTLKSVLEPRDIAAMALFLASDAARLITKQSFIVDAGMV